MRLFSLGAGAGLVLAGLLLLAGLSAPAALAGHPERGWQGGFERLHYRVHWGYLTVGEAIIQARSPEPGRAELLSETCTDGLVDSLYEERDRILAHSRVNAGGWRTEAFRTALEKGAEDRTRQYRFSGKGVVYIRDLVSGNNDYLPVPAGTMDALTALNAVRASPLEPGSRLSLPVLDRGERFRLVVAVQGRERLDTMLGDATATIRIRTHLEEAAGGRHQRPMQVWLTADHRRIPVRLKAEAGLGRITLELQRIRTEVPANPRAGLECR